ncbi:hypothetical protein LCGC14_3036260, partial [marine sediment metagenome]
RAVNTSGAKVQAVHWTAYAALRSLIEWVDDYDVISPETDWDAIADALGSAVIAETAVDALTLDEAIGDLLDSAIAAGAEPKRCVNLLMGRGSAIANERGCTIAGIGLTAEQLAELAKMLAEGKVNATAAEKILEKMIADGSSPSAVAEAAGLLAVSDTDQIAEWVAQAIAANPQAVNQLGISAALIRGDHDGRPARHAARAVPARPVDPA